MLSLRGPSAVGVDPVSLGFGLRAAFGLALVVSAITSVAFAAGLGISGFVKFSGAAPTGVRVALFTVDRVGRPLQEIASAAAGSDGSFSLQAPAAPPASPSRQTLTSDGLSWPGIVGNVTFTGTPRVVLAKLGAYLDLDGSKSFTPADTLLDSTVTRDVPGGVIVLWADARFLAAAGRGFQATFEPGWNAVVVEAGKTVSATRVTRLEHLRLDAFSH